MTDERPVDPGQFSLTPPEQPPPPPAPPESMGPPPAWMPAPPPAPAPSVWHRIAAFVVLIAVVAAAAGAGIGFSIARAIHPNHIAQASPIAPPMQTTPPATAHGRTRDR